MIVEEMIKTITEEIAEMISTKTVVGDHITIDGRTIIPVTKVSFGFGSGGGEGKKNGKDEGTGGGGGGGAVITPVAFLVITQDDIKLLTIKDKGSLAQLTDVLPEMMDKYKSIMDERKNPKSEQSEE
ncbi:MAG TPA: spore germination protein GerW family protein [Candidatus Nanoarchaeia archaeon]|nr:spore germination protein GerW family protein [Candidatus Nanoarchaeia archaeon]